MQYLQEIICSKSSKSLLLNKLPAVTAFTIWVNSRVYPLFLYYYCYALNIWWNMSGVVCLLKDREGALEGKGWEPLLYTLHCPAKLLHRLTSQYLSNYFKHLKDLIGHDTNSASNDSLFILTDMVWREKAELSPLSGSFSSVKTHTAQSPSIYMTEFLFKRKCSTRLKTT